MMYKNLILIFICILFYRNIDGQNFYDVNTINTVKLTFKQSNWDYKLDSLVNDGNENRLLGSATVNGIHYDSVGVRYKGNSSYNASRIKNPLNIKLDYVIDNQEHEGYGTLKLANVYNDPSFVREVLSYEIIGKYMPSSLANYCKVYINDKYIGLYTNVQDVDKSFLKTHFGSSKNAFFKGELARGAAQSSVKIWGYFGEDSSAYSNYYEIESDYGWKELINFLRILNNNPSSVDQVLNVDRHLWMLAFDILTVNLDSPINFAHNYYLYEDDSGRFNPIVWDFNENFGVFSRLLDGAALTTSSMQQLDPFLNSSKSNFPIISKILSDQTIKKKYVAHMKSIMSDYFENGLYKTRAFELQNIIDIEVQNDPNKFYSYTQFKNNITSSISSGGPPGGGNQGIVGISQLMDSRISYLNSVAEFKATPPSVTDISHSAVNGDIDKSLWINVNVQNANIVQLYYRASAKDVFNKIDMLDDGNNNDGSAGDAVYGALLPLTTTEIQYYIYAENNAAASFSPERAEIEFYTITSTGDLVINEFMASNDDTAADQDGEYDDWIELYNNSENDISLNGYFLSDKTNDLSQWTLPDTVIKAKDYLIIWADDQSSQSGLHANFKLSSSGESIYLSDPDTVIIDEVFFGEQLLNISTGRYPNGTGSFKQMTPSFAKQNNSDITVVEDNESTTIFPEHFTLYQNYPNPFNPETTISLYLPDKSMVTVKIFNSLGQLVTTLVNRQLSKGNFQFNWNAKDFASGIYYYNVSLDGINAGTKKMLILK